jgi:hypothetical protein
MKLAQKLDEILEEARLAERKYFWKHERGTAQSDFNLKQPQGDLLFFPRKLVRLEKIRSGFWEPRAWFIQDRLNQKSTSLEVPTQLSKQGITSGLRSTIIKEPNGTYLRLKGVAPNTYEHQRQFFGPASKHLDCELRGLCRIEEAIDEQAYTSILRYTRTLSSTMKPAYVEYFLVPQYTNTDLSDFVVLFQTQHKDKSRLETTVKDDELGLKKINLFYKQAKKRRNPKYFAMVSAFEITGDTRLDEAFYELTKEQLAGDKLYERNELMKYLSYSAGISLALFTRLNLVWSGKLDATNSHLGNFVVDRKDGLIRVVLSDLGAISFFNNFSTDKEAYNHLEKDIRAFKEDFFADLTTSHPKSLYYKNFPKYLRQQCYDSFTTGFAAIMHNENMLHKLVFPQIIVPEKVTVPKQLIICESEFREKLEYIAKK